MSEVYDELAQLSADIRATLEWARLTGSEVLPREKLERLVAVPIARPADRAQHTPPTWAAVLLVLGLRLLCSRHVPRSHRYARTVRRIIPAPCRG